MDKKSVFDLPYPLSKRRTILLLINYCLGYMFLYPIIGNIFQHVFRGVSYLTVMCVIYGWTLFITLYLAMPLYKESYCTWKQNKTEIIRKNIILLIGIYVVSIFISFVVQQLTNTVTSNNQLNLVLMVWRFPYFTAFLVLAFAPIVEETLFRGIFYRAFRYRFSLYAASFISSSAFGFLHIYDSFMAGYWKDCWYFIVYALIGFFLCRSYEKTETLFGPVLLHACYNGISFLPLIL